MRIAILGATSEIAKDLVHSFATLTNQELYLYARRPIAVEKWLSAVGLPNRYPVKDYVEFSTELNFDAILNFVGVGNPKLSLEMGASIFDITLQYDELALNYVRQHPACRYIFLSSGAAYGESFNAPVDSDSKAQIAINDLLPQDWYAIAKLHAESRHRALAPLSIVDIRVFNYFSHTQDLEANFLITDLVRAIRDKNVFKTSAYNIVRDYIAPADFYQLVNAILTSPADNVAVDCYSLAPIDKSTLLIELQESFGLQYEFINTTINYNINRQKSIYYSINKKAFNYGYKPSINSLDCIKKELNIIFRNK